MSSSSNVELGLPGQSGSPGGPGQWAAKLMARAGWLRTMVVGAAMAIVLGVPFWLRPDASEELRQSDEVLVIVSPHNDTIRGEFAAAFSEHMKAKNGEGARIEWRDLGGTSDVSKFIDGSFRAAFELHWRKNVKNGKWKGKGGPGDAAVSKITPDGTPGDDSDLEKARREFLQSDVGIGIDLFFGGGPYYFNRHASRGHLVDSGIFEAEPGWFEEEVIPQKASGELLYDPDRRWVGNCLSSFGILYNTDWLERLELEPPTQWSDLGDPGYLRTIALADPTKSGSANTAFEMLIQQHLATAVGAIDPEKVVDRGQATEDALNLGWTKGLNLIQRIAANARYWTDQSTKIPYDVSQGNAAAGMTIDFYGRTLNERLRKEDGSSRAQFVAPTGGTSIGADPIAMFRGAPRPKLALEFIRFVLSPEGQRLWHYRTDAPGGPKLHALRRLPIRKDAYTPDELKHSSDPEVMPYERAEQFYYHAEWTSPHFDMIKFIIQVMCLENHEELQEAWMALAEAEFPPRATRIFHDVSQVGYTNITGDLKDKLKASDVLAIEKLRRDLREGFRKNYEDAAILAKRGL